MSQAVVWAVNALHNEMNPELNYTGKFKPAASPPHPLHIKEDWLTTTHFGGGYNNTVQPKQPRHLIIFWSSFEVTNNSCYNWAVKRELVDHNTLQRFDISLSLRINCFLRAGVQQDPLPAVRVAVAWSKTIRNSGIVLNDLLLARRSIFKGIRPLAFAEKLWNCNMKVWLN